MEIRANGVRHPMELTPPSGATVPADHPGPGHTSWRQRMIRWGIGSSLMSVAGLIALGLFEQYNSMLSELRSDLKRFNETSAEFVKRDQMQRCREQVWQNTKELQTLHAAQAPITHELHASERCREELQKEMQRLRERLAYLEGLHAQVQSYKP